MISIRNVLAKKNLKDIAKSEQNLGENSSHYSDNPIVIREQSAETGIYLVTYPNNFNRNQNPELPEERHEVYIDREKIQAIPDPISDIEESQTLLEKMMEDTQVNIRLFGEFKAREARVKYNPKAEELRALKGTYEV